MSKRLVAVWVSNYMGIENQGFNLGGKHTFDFRLSDNTLTIEVKETINYVDLFQNSSAITNVTGIVGVNGTGKSSFLKLLNMIFAQKPLFAPVVLIFEEGTEYIYYDYIGIKMLSFIRIANPRVRLNMSSLITERKDDEIQRMFNDLALIFYNPILSSSESIYFKREHFIDYSATAEFLSTEVKSSGGKLLDDFKILLHSRQIDLFAWLNKNLDIFKQQDRESMKLLKEINPESIVIIFSDEKLKVEWEKKQPSKELYKQLIEHLENMPKSIESSPLPLNNLLNLYVKLYIYLFLSECNTILDFFKNIEIKEIGLDESYINLKFDELKLDKIFLDKVEEFKVSENEEVSFRNGRFLMKITESTNSFIRKLRATSTHIDNGIVYGWPRNFSTGQEALMSQFAELFSVIRNDNNEKKDQLEAENIIISIDEGEAYFHPEWQRKYISSLCSFLEVVNEVQGLNKKFQIILTSHSPFIVSDIPHYNLIKLQKDENGFTKVMNNQETETLGGNIFRLFQDEFFVDEFISAFAYEKIKEAVEYIKSSGEKRATFKNDEDVSKFISLIGESVIRNQLRSMFERYKRNKAN
ncbi:AAA family ATPase [Flectobacillus rivi]|uniref:AAA family ATPase n=1 Tax=Flectobacillus rivi TaxID=2984209 RepID=A0ABT6Z5T5_9BACT|nr:AAA family ATPase [Flectobacillus rivi]MDI9876498.1 AAA family ATPase [Flectobacillus rivi]